MRHVVVEGSHRISVTDAPDPHLPGEGGALVAVEAAGICGSDLHFYDGDIPVGAPFAIGHEFVGVVSEVGTAVRRWRPGDRVLAASVTGCGACDGCATGDPVTCVQGPQVFGSGSLGGGQATVVAVPAADFQLQAIPDGMSAETALLLTDNLNTGWIAARKADIPPGGTVAVLGLGPVGLCSVRAAYAQGAGRVLGIDPVAGRRRVAAASGAEPVQGDTVDTVMALTGGRGADSVIDAVALDATLDASFDCVRAGGTISVVGVHDLRPYPVPVLTSLFRSITLRMTTAPVQQTWKELIPLVVNGRLATDGIFTHRFALDDAPRAYEVAAARGEDTLKVMLLPEGVTP